MNHTEELYCYRNEPEFAKKNLGYFLLFQIYSAPIIRETYRKWPELPAFIRENTPAEIVTLIDKSTHFSDRKLRKRLNQYYIEKAVQVLKNYQNCAVPLTDDPTIKQTRRKLTSAVGDRNLKILERAKEQRVFTDKMADLAIHCTHKFLFDSKNYRSWHISSKLAQAMAQDHGNGEITFPAIQLTKGCGNNCSHCCERATNHLSHMPWPVFVNLYKAFQKHYCRYPHESGDSQFAKFFADSDMLSYRDPIMGTDAGDLGIWMTENEGLCQYLTRGVTDEASKLALTKAIISQQPITLSFVDTPKEDMTYNMQQLSDTLDVFESIPQRNYNPLILHLQMKSGPTVPDEIFRNFPVEKKGIWAMGRAKDLPDTETEHYPDGQFFAPDIIAPNGDILLCRIKNGERMNSKVSSLYGIPPRGHKRSLCQKLARLFKRQR